MRLLVSAVLLRVGRLDAFDVDAQPQPPYCQLRQTEDTVGELNGLEYSKWCAHTTPDAIRTNDRMNVLLSAMKSSQTIRTWPSPTFLAGTELGYHLSHLCPWSNGTGYANRKRLLLFPIVEESPSSLAGELTRNHAA